MPSTALCLAVMSSASLHHRALFNRLATLLFLLFGSWLMCLTEPEADWAPCSLDVLDYLPLL